MEEWNHILYDLYVCFQIVTLCNHHDKHGQGIITFYFTVFSQAGTSFLLFGKVFQGNKNQMGHKKFCLIK